MGHSYRFKIGRDWRFRRPRPSAGRPGSPRPFDRAAKPDEVRKRFCAPHGSQASAATILLGLLSECRFGRRRVGELRLAGVSGLALEALFLRETCLPAKSRRTFAVRLAALVRRSLGPRF